jgi:hypothetical protein
MTTTAILILVLVALLALYGAVSIVLAVANHYQRRNGREPFDLDRADGLYR